MPKVDIVKLQHIADRTWNMSSNIIDSAMYGKYKTYKTNLIEYSSYALKNFDTVKQIPFPKVTNIPLFSKEGRNLLKTNFLELFRFRTKDEKLLAKLFREHNIRQLIEKSIPIPNSLYYPKRIRNIELSRKIIFSSLTGNHKNYVENLQEYASFIVKNPDMAHYIVFGNVRVSALSKEGFNMFKVSLLDKFRTKSKDEKLMKEIIKQEKVNNPVFRVHH